VVTPPAPGVAALDRLARRLVTAALPLRLDVARGSGELRAVQRLRFEHVVEHGWARPDDFPDGLESDAHDDIAVPVAAWDGSVLVGTVRVVPPVAGRRLPTEEAFGLSIEPVGAVADMGRLVIAPSYRGDPSHRILGALLARGWQELRARGLEVVAGAAAAPLLERYRALGFQFELLGPPQHYWGEPRSPLRVDPRGATAARWEPTAPAP
jgi:hypothetical protein